MIFVFSTDTGDGRWDFSGARPGACKGCTKCSRRFPGRSAIITHGLALAVVLYPAEVGSRIAFYVETLNPFSSASAIGFRGISYPMQNLATAFDDPNWLLGNGTGTASLGLQYVAKLLHSSFRGKWTEEGYGQLMLEMGILAPILWVLWSSALLYGCWKIVRRLRQTPLFPVAFSIMWFAFLLLFPMTFGGTSAYQNYINNAFLWLLVGSPLPAAGNRGDAGGTRCRAPQTRRRPFAILEKRGAPEMLGLFRSNPASSDAAFTSQSLFQFFLFADGRIQLPLRETDGNFLSESDLIGRAQHAAGSVVGDRHSRVRAVETGCARAAATPRLPARRRRATSKRSIRFRSSAERCSTMRRSLPTRARRSSAANRRCAVMNRRRFCVIRRSSAAKSLVRCWSILRRSTAARPRRSNDEICALAFVSRCRAIARRRRRLDRERRRKARRAAGGAAAPAIRAGGSRDAFANRARDGAAPKASSACDAPAGAGIRRCGVRIPGASAPRFPPPRKAWERAGPRRNRRS